MGYKHRGLLVREGFPHARQQDPPGQGAREQGQASQALGLTSYGALRGQMALIRAQEQSSKWPNPGRHDSIRQHQVP